MPKEDIKKLERYYKEELQKKDKEIQKLKEDNLVLLKSALKQAEKASKISGHARKLLDLNKKLSQKK